MNFLQQLEELRAKTPIPALFFLQAENSPYSTYSAYMKNCYLAFGCGEAEDVLYCTYIFGSKDLVDCHFVIDSELCSFCTDCDHCYNSDFCQDCRECTDCILMFDCIGCMDCFGCVGLRRQKFHIFNNIYSEEEYKKRLVDLKRRFYDLNEREKLFEEFEALKHEHPHLFVRQLNTENCVGDYVFNSKNCFFCYDAHDAEDCLYCERPMKGCKDLVDCAYCYDHSENCYEIVSGVKIFNSNFCYFCWFSNDLEYCEFVFNSHDCFGCIGLNHKEYHILNEPYSEEEYLKKKAEIISEMKAQGIYGQHLASPFPVEDTVVSDYFK